MSEKVEVVTELPSQAKNVLNKKVLMGVAASIIAVGAYVAISKLKNRSATVEVSVGTEETEAA